MPSSTAASCPSVSGAASRRSVWPVGAVSTTTSSYPPGAGEALQLHQPDQLVHAGQGEAEQPVDLGAVQVGAALDDGGRARSRRVAVHRASARSASSSTARSSPRRVRTRRGRAPRRVARASPREWAGSVETRRTRAAGLGAASAVAAATVVLPTPPLPPKRRKSGSATAPAPGLPPTRALGHRLRVLAALERHLRAGHAKRAGLGRLPLSPLADLADARRAGRPRRARTPPRRSRPARAASGRPAAPREERRRRSSPPRRRRRACRGRSGARR